MNKSFDGCIAFIEDELNIHLLSWQKEMLRHIYENKPYYFMPGRGCGLTTFNKAHILLEVYKKENNNEQN